MHLQLTVSLAHAEELESADCETIERKLPRRLIIHTVDERAGLFADPAELGIMENSQCDTGVVTKGQCLIRSTSTEIAMIIQLSIKRILH